MTGDLHLWDVLLTSCLGKKHLSCHVHVLRYIQTGWEYLPPRPAVGTKSLFCFQRCVGTRAVSHCVTLCQDSNTKKFSSPNILRLPVSHTYNVSKAPIHHPMGKLSTAIICLWLRDRLGIF